MVKVQLAHNSMRIRRSITMRYMSTFVCVLLALVHSELCNASASTAATETGSPGTTITLTAPTTTTTLAPENPSTPTDKRIQDKLATSVFSINTQSIQDMVLQYIDETLNRRTYELLAGLTLDQKLPSGDVGGIATARSADGSDETFDVKLVRRLKRFADTHVVNLSISRALQATAKTFFFKSLKKVMWPLFIGLQVVKTMLLAMFLPSIIGSLGKIVGKGLSSVSGFGAPADTVENLEFKDTYANIEAEDANYGYQQPYAQSGDNMPSPSFATHMYDSANANNALSRFGIGGNQVTYVGSANEYGQQQQQQRPVSAFVKKTDFKDFHDIPASSMLLTNYDPFYSPLLSRLDAVFQQMALPAGNEKCREKLVCLMYASPAKYAPYSNLVSAQLSRELNELKKPTSDNPDILRFFKYMRAAKDGQDQMNCNDAFSECAALSDSDSPAMLTTYNDINKLVQARRL